MYEYITSHGKLNQYHLKKIEQTIDKALSEHSRVLAVRIDLHTPVLKPLNDMPDEANFARTDSSVISRFTDSLKAKISHHLNKREKEGKRVRKTSLRVVWAREFVPDSHKKHYHVLLLLNGDTFNTLGAYDSNKGTLRRLIRESWMSAVSFIYPPDKELVHIPRNPCYYLSAKDGKQSESYGSLIYRTSYFAKKKSKCFTDGERNFGCSFK